MMMTMGWIFTIIMTIGGLFLCAADASKKESTHATKVIIHTNKGDIHVELYDDKAPKTVENFIKYVKMGHYDNTIFHRVIPNFMIQGGGFTAKMEQKPTQAPIVNEATNGLKNARGTIAMARTMDINSATSQFFINLVDNDFLNNRDKTSSGFGYCVFGKVINGMDVVDKIGKVQTSTRGQYGDVPVEPVVITQIALGE